MTSEVSRNVTLLDCTLRDGGYYNDWDFPSDLVSKYLNALGQARVPVVELGFRFLRPKGFAGPTAHTTDAYLSELEVPPSVKLAVMLNAKDLVTFYSGAAAAVNELFLPSGQSRVDLVRIATTWTELQNLKPSVQRLLELGYEVGVNLMQVHTHSFDELKEFGLWCTGVGANVAYFADSFGGLYPADIAPIVRAISEEFEGPVGCHLHDNMSLAMANSIAAVQAGVTWVDSTIRGMGRGPGNARTEYLAVEFNRLGLIDVDVQHLLDLVTDDFAKLQAKFGWGTDLFYLLSATNHVHPSYVQSMVADPRYNAEDIVATIEQLGRTGGATFRMELAVDSSFATFQSEPGTWDATGWCEDRNVLIIGPGPSTIKRRDDIERYIARNQPLVMNLNLSPLVEPSLIDVYVVCNPIRAKLDKRNLPDSSVLVVAPSNVASVIAAWPKAITVLDYGIAVAEDAFMIEATGCTVPHGLVAAYALALTAKGGAKEISLAGFDGFNSEDPRQEEMIYVFERYGETPGTPGLLSLTPTSYPVKKSSIYAPHCP